MTPTQGDLPLETQAAALPTHASTPVFQLEKVTVEVTAKQGDSSTERGALLEGLAKRLLVALNYEHVETTVKVTGMEIDVVGTDRHTAQKVLLECKAYRDQTISADTIFKLLGQVQWRAFSSGWLVCTSELGKEAKGIRDEYLGKPPEERARLRFYDPTELVTALVNAGQVIDPRRLPIDLSRKLTRVATLLVTDVGEYWALTALGKVSGVADTVLVYDAVTGHRVTDVSLLRALSERDSNLKPLTWLTSESTSSPLQVLGDSALRKELDSIAPVPVADDWSDYRPARPSDFVGRGELLRDLIDTLEAARSQGSPTRLIAIKSPSGWGKSSFLNKLRATCGNVRHRGRFFLYPVDCRTALSARYPELALKKCIDEAARSKFLSGKDAPVSITSVGDPFSDATMQGVLAELRQHQKIIVLFFDQFEEITTRQEFSDLFSAIRSLCSAIDSAKEPILLGFSWKTDGTIPTDHPAYHMWHQFADRRREFGLSLFSSGEITTLLNHLSRELETQIDPSLRRLLADHCQGYPWLLKKLCIHVFGALRSKPNKQRELLERALNVDALFKQDLASLSPREIACVQRIAKESPADYYQVDNAFGGDTIRKLIDKRLVVRSSEKLVLYWDIFREYVLTNRAPTIPNRYIPLTGPLRAKELLQALTTRRPVSLSALASRFGLKTVTLDNIARDLVMLGAAQYDRKEQRIRLVPGSVKELMTTLYGYFRNHAVTKFLIDKHGPGTNVPVSDVVLALKASAPTEQYGDQTWQYTARRLLAWLRALGIVRLVTLQHVVLTATTTVPETLDQLQILTARSRRLLFKGDAPPQRVVELTEKMLQDTYVASPEDRNALNVLRSLGLVSSTAKPVLGERPIGDRNLWLAEKALNTSTIEAAWKILRDNPEASAVQLGQVVQTLGGHSLANSSKLRYGNGLHVWIRWIKELLKQHLAVEER